MPTNKALKLSKIADKETRDDTPTTPEGQSLNETQISETERARDNIDTLLAENAGLKESLKQLNIEVLSGETPEHLYYRIWSNYSENLFEEHSHFFSKFLALPISFQKEVLISYINALGNEQGQISRFFRKIEHFYSFRPRHYIKELREYAARVAAEKDPIDFLKNTYNFFSPLYDNNDQLKLKRELLELAIHNAAKKDPVKFMEENVSKYYPELLELAARNAVEKDPVKFMEFIISSGNARNIEDKPYFSELFELAVQNATKKNPEDASKYTEYIIQGRYSDLLGEYQRLYNKIKNLSQRQNNPNLQDKLKALDDERHQTHLQLLDLGAQLGKDKESVFADIIRKNKTLDELGLPEFSILVENDIVEHSEDRALLMSDDDIRIHRPRFQNAESLIPKDKCILVFDIAEAQTDETGQFTNTVETGVKWERAEALARAIGGEVFSEQDSEFHDASVLIVGVMFPKKELEKVAAIIRDNPEKYRLKKEFFSEDERKKMA
jgi:hypothetical protein